MSATGQSGGPLDGVPVVQGALAGIGAYVLGYVLTLVLAAVDSGAGDTGAGVIESVGWLFYGAHYVDIVVTGADVSLDVFVDLQFPQVVYTFVPVVVLIAAGFVLARRFADGPNLMSGVKAGVTVVAGYLPLVVGGAFLFSDVGVEPDPLTAIVLAGLAFPLILGAVGGIVAIRSR